MPILGFNFNFKIAQTIYNKYHIFCTYSHTVEFPSSIMNLDNNLRKTWNVHFGNISLIVTKFDNGFHLNACAIVMKNKTRLKKRSYTKKVSWYSSSTQQWRKQVKIVFLSLNCWYSVQIDKFPFHFIISVV